MKKVLLFFKLNKAELIIITLIYGLIYYGLTTLYAFPALIPDSNGYVVSAIQNRYLGYRPMGYSIFLTIIHGISDSLNFLVFSQFFLSYLSTLFFILSIKYLFKPANKLSIILYYLFAIASPSVIYLTNTILSDSLFSSLTIFWACFGLWFLNSKKIWYKLLFLIFQLICLYFLAKVRYTGLFYFAIQFLIITYVFFKKHKLIGLASIVIVFFIGKKIYTNQVNDTFNISKVKTFSGFSGWQMANNALHVVPHIKLDLSDFKNPETKDFAKFVMENDSLLAVDSYTTTSNFLWEKKLPLKQYLAKQIALKHNYYLKTWTLLGKDIYQDFGMTVIKNHPIAYFRYFMFPTFLGILYPAKDQLYTKYDTKSIKTETFDQWFTYDKENLESKNTVINEFAPFSVYRLTIWIFVFLTLIFSVVFKLWKKVPKTNYVQFFFITFFLLSYVLFHMYSASFEARYIAPIHLIQITIIYIIINTLLNKQTSKDDN